MPDSGNSHCPEGSIGSLPADIFHRTQGNAGALTSFESNASLADSSEPRRGSFDRSDGGRHGNGSGANYPAFQSMTTCGSGPFQSDSDAGQMDCLPRPNSGFQETRSSSSFQLVFFVDTFLKSNLFETLGCFHHMLYFFLLAHPERKAHAF